MHDIWQKVTTLEARYACVCAGGLVSWFQFFNLLVLIRNRTRFSIITIYRKMVEKK